MDCRAATWSTSCLANCWRAGKQEALGLSKPNHSAAILRPVALAVAPSARTIKYSQLGTIMVR